MRICGEVKCASVERGGRNRSIVKKMVASKGDGEYPVSKQHDEVKSGEAKIKSFEAEKTI